MVERRSMGMRRGRSSVRIRHPAPVLVFGRDCGASNEGVHAKNYPRLACVSGESSSLLRFDWGSLHAEIISGESVGPDSANQVRRRWITTQAGAVVGATVARQLLDSHCVV